MRNLVIGFIFGLVISAVGFSGLARVFDHGVSKVQEVAKEAAK
jgi:capsular polysaccharide biosynthesis protein